VSAGSTIEAAAAAWVAARAAEASALETSANLAGWEAAITGTDEDIERSADARGAVRRLYSDPEAARTVRGFLASVEVRDPLLRRQLVLLDHAYTGNQLAPETLDDLTRRETELEQIYYAFRADFEGARVSNNLLLDVLRTETDSARRRAAWDASKQIGPRVAEPLRALVRARNEAARSLGYSSYYSMALALQEIEEGTLFRVLDDFRRGTDAPFAELRAAMDDSLARRFDVAPEGLRPWHWEDFFCQEAPSLGSVDLDPYFHSVDLVEIARRYFAGIGLPVEEVLASSDLYEREGKDQHAFCADIDRQGDVRVLCNLRQNERWMGTLLHELGHAAYDRFIPASLPYILRTVAHTMVTEAIAMFMGRLTRDPEWLARETGAELDEGARRDVRDQLRTGMLVATRWMLVMAYFERELYRDPDRPDLDDLWWGLVEEIQLVRRPEVRSGSDWATKIHLSLAPVYYHNYLLGELIASQLGARISTLVTDGGATAGDEVVGSYLRERVFAAGATLPWHELIASATGEELSARHFIRDFVEEVLE
jgi:peptidyl-dipeptidase A